MTVVVLAVAVLAVALPDAQPVLDKLLPVLTLVLGYYFGQSAVKR